MMMEGGGGGGCVTEPAPPPPQPRVHATAVRRAVVRANALTADKPFLIVFCVSRSCGRGRMPFAMQKSIHNWPRARDNSAETPRAVRRFLRTILSAR